MPSKFFKICLAVLVLLCIFIIAFIAKSDFEARRTLKMANGCYYLEVHHSVYSLAPAQTVKVYSECTMGQTFVSAPAAGYSPAHATKTSPGVYTVTSDRTAVRYEGMVLGPR